MSDTSTPALKLAVPKSVGAVVGAAALTTFLLSSIFLAIYNLLHDLAIIPSLMWLSLIGFIFFDECKRRGINNLVVKILGAFSRKEFVQVINNEGQQNEVRFGYQVFGRLFFYFKIPGEKIESLEWGAGQASGRMGRDMNDWSVHIWHKHDDPTNSKKQRRTHYLYIIGPAGPKEKTEIFGHALLVFLRNSGVSLTQGVSDCIYIGPAYQS